MWWWIHTIIMNGSFLWLCFLFFFIYMCLFFVFVSSHYFIIVNLSTPCLFSLLLERYYLKGARLFFILLLLVFFFFTLCMHFVLLSLLTTFFPFLLQCFLFCNSWFFFLHCYYFMKKYFHQCFVVLLMFCFYQQKLTCFTIAIELLAFHYFSLLLLFTRWKKILSYFCFQYVFYVLCIHFLCYWCFVKSNFH